MNEIKIKAVDSGKIKDYRKEVLISIEEYNQYCDACKQLQAYKDREDKMREALEELKKEMWKIWRILNEGDK